MVSLSGLTIGAPLQVFLTMTLLSLKIINTDDYTDSERIHVGVLSIGFELITMLTALLKSLFRVTEDTHNDRWYYVSAALPIFAFRMIGWQVVILILADLSVIVFGAEIFINGIILYLMQRDQLAVEPISTAVQSIIFPKVAFYPGIQKSSIHLNILVVLTTVGNVLLMIVLTIVFVLCSLNVYNLWNENEPRPTLMSKNGFEIIFWSSVPLFFAATVPTIIEKKMTIFNWVEISNILF